MAGHFTRDLRYNKKDNQAVFRENDESDTLYYIVSGSRRSATVKSVGKSVLFARLLARRLQKLNRKAGRLL